MKTTPYRDLPQHCFWRRGVSDLEPGELDPFVSVPFTIARDDKVATAGSCFAQHIARYLKDAGFDFLTTEPIHGLINAREAAAYNYGTYTARYGNIYTVRQLLQLFQRAYGRLVPHEDVWIDNGQYIDPFRPQIQPGGFASLREFNGDRARHFAAVRKAFESLDVFVFTFGLTEGWMSTVDGAVFPLCPGVAGGIFDAERHRMHNFTLAEVVDDSLEFIDLLRSVNPAAKVILTVSPVPLAATAVREQHVLTATTYSKSVLRVACAEIVRQRPLVAYVPSYELITGSPSQGRYFAPDLRSVNEAGVAHVMRLFLKHFAGVQAHGSQDAPPDQPKTGYDAAMNRVVAVNCEEEMLLGLVEQAEAQLPLCNVCGGQNFGPGPGGRLLDDGRGPRCLNCRSLERDRAAATLVRRIPAERLAAQRALVIGPAQSVDSRWFRELVHESLSHDAPGRQLQGQAGARYDYIALMYELEFVRDDKAVFDELCGLLSPTGILQVGFMSPERRKTTEIGGSPTITGTARRLYGADVADYFACREKGLDATWVRAVDPHSGAPHIIHFFGKAEALAQTVFKFSPRPSA